MLSGGMLVLNVGVNSKGDKMKLTPKLKQWALSNCDVKADASDDEFSLAVAKALTSGKLDANEFKAMSTDEEKATEANEFSKKFDQLLDLLSARQTEETKATEKTEEKDAKTEEKTTDHSWYEKVVTNVLGSDDKGSSVRVKGAHEQYSTTKSALTYPERTKKGTPHPSAGQPVYDFSEKGRLLESASELDAAVCGAYSQFMIRSAQLNGNRNAAFASLTEHSRELLSYAMMEMKWGGSTNPLDSHYADIVNRKLTPFEQKALIDDATSGGIEAAPIVFDDMVIQAPLLTNELYPLVNVIPLDRGRRIEGVSIGKVTSSWGGVDDTAITLFNTATYVSAFDTTIYRWEGAIKIGLDFLSDTPIDFGSIVTAQYGERLAEDLDDVIAAGNGTTQPEGIINKSGTTSVAWGGTTSLSNYESLRFGVTKAEHTPAARGSAIFCGTETSYMRARALPVGASDERRLFGMDYDSYSIMGRPFKINETLSNSQIFYAIMSRYRMYRRRGLTIRTSTEGDTLIRDNEMLIAVTARFGGQLERGACAAKTTTAPS